MTISLLDLIQEKVGDNFYGVSVYKKESKSWTPFQKLNIKAKSWKEAKEKVRKKYPPEKFRYEYEGYSGV
mgnify:CR=1 FL=1